ncbi:nicotinamide-nucleotide adenylyltransferase [Candidatus Peregrinibacteria bacterium]|nr:nicotinamide-nucleotide adenylyltransferase [Candidatus Peregrinibacteria bacterium]
MKKRALYIGRFQPIHLGHVDAIQQILKHPDHFDEIIIAIGSAEDSFLLENPLTASERFELILGVLEEMKIPREKVWILPVRNIDNYALWPAHVIHLCPEFNAVFSGSPIVRKLFHDFTEKKVYEINTKRVCISATEIRKKVKKGEDVSSFLPKSVQEYLQKLDFRKRLQEIE